MITKIVYARLFNLGNFENERLEVEVTVENGDVAGAFYDAHTTVLEQQARLVNVREEAERKAAEERRAQWEARKREPDPEF